MKTLDSIQKTYKVFGTLAKIAMILSFILAGTALLGALAGIVWRLGGDIAGVPMDYILDLTETESLDQMIALMLGSFVIALTDGLLLIFALRYFRQEQADGTPFTTTGADQVRSLGIKAIVMPLVAVAIVAVIYKCFGMTSYGNWDNGSAVALGIALILFSLVLRHGAELREKSETAAE